MQQRSYKSVQEKLDEEAKLKKEINRIIVEKRTEYNDHKKELKLLENHKFYFKTEFTNIIDTIQNRISELNDIETDIQENGVNLDDLGNFKSRLDDDNAKATDLSIIKQIVEFKDNIRNKQIAESLKLQLPPAIHTERYTNDTGIAKVKEQNDNRINEKKKITENINKNVYKKEEFINISLNEPYNNFQFKYIINDFIIFKKNDDIFFNIGKIVYLYKYNNESIIYIKTIEPIKTLLNEGILYWDWIGLADKQELQIFINKYETIDDNYMILPLTIFCNITSNIQKNLDALFSVNDTKISILNINSDDAIRKELNISTYFEILPFFGIRHQIIEEHLNQYMKIHDDFNNFLNNKTIDKSNLINQLKIDDNNYIENININNDIFALKEMYSKLLDQMPINLHPKTLQMNSPKPKKKGR